MNRYLLFILLPIALISCRQENTAVAKGYHVGDADSLFSDFYEFKKNINPIEATKAGFNEYNDTIANYISDEYQLFAKEKYTYFLDQLSQFDSTMVSSEDWMSLRVMDWDCTVKLEGLMNPIKTIASPIYDLPSFELMPLFQIQSLHLYVAQLAGGTSVQPFDTEQDYRNWLKRLDDYLIFLDTSMLKMQEGMQKNVVAPKVLIQKMLPQLDAFIDIPVTDNVYYKPILQLPNSFSDAVKEELTASYTEFINTKLEPKYVELYDFVKDSYLPAGRDTDGLGALPNGPDTYNYLIKLHTTTNMTANEIHELGLKEVARISAEMNTIKNELGFKGDLKDFFVELRQKKELVPFEKPEEVIANFNAINGRISKTLGDVFSLRPKAGFEVRRTEGFREASASAEYVPGSKDAKRPGTFYVPIPDISTYNTLQDEALFLHEAIPGHHYQLSLQQENKDLPEFLHPESMGVFVEGWALYAESLGKELGLYEDPYQYFGMLSMEMHRAIRLVVDTGIHAKGWSREEAIAFSLENEAESEDNIVAEVERYMATPGQALSYKIGQLKIRELRTRAEKELGASFDVRKFHNQVLNSGSLPLVLLEEKIGRWIASQKRN